MMKTFICSLIVLFGFEASAIAQNQDIEFHLNQNGFSTIVEEIERQLLDGDDLKLIGDLSGVVKENINFEIKGLKYKAKVQEFTITPEYGYLDVKVKVKKAYVEADAVKIKTQILGHDYESTCFDVAMDFDREEMRSLAGQIGGKVEKGKLKLFVQNLSYDLSSKDIDVIGPEKCTGHFGTGWIVKIVLRSFLKKTRTILESELQKVLGTIVSMIEEPINEYITQTFKLDLESLDPLPALTLYVTTKPLQVVIDKDGLRFGMDTEVKLGDEEDSLVPKRVELPGSYKLGDIGIDPRFVAEAVDNIFPDGFGFIELNQYIPALNEYLTTATASVVWPFLVNEDLEKSYLKVFLRVHRSPTLEVDPEYGGFRIGVPDLRVRFQLYKEDEWKDFFEMRANIVAKATASIEQRRLSFLLDERNDYVVEGFFIGEYEQQIDVDYDQEMADMILGGALDFIHGSAPFIGIDIPITDIAGLKVTAEETYFDDRFVRVGIVESDP